MRRIFLLTAFLLINSSAIWASNNSNNILPSRHASLVIDYDTKNILHQENADKPRYPASLTKMMTLYLTFEAIKSGNLSFNQELTVSAHAAKTQYSSLLKLGQKVTVRDLILAAIVKSANDATVVLAEKIASSEPKFAQLMTMKAKQLGMNNTSFYNAHGLYHAEQKTTAFDMAKLAIALHRDFPEYYHLFSHTKFTYKNNVYHGHNRVLQNYPGANGLKTGFINASGYNIVTTAKRGDAMLIAVVMGGETYQKRDNKIMRLLNLYFSGNEMAAQVDQLTKPVIKKSTKQSKAKKTIPAKTRKKKNKSA